MAGVSYDGLPLADKLRCDEICRRFELQLLADGQAEVQEFLVDVEERLRPALFCELLQLEIELRGESCSRQLPQQYAERFPEFANLISQISVEDPAWQSHSEGEVSLDSGDLSGADVLVGEYRIQQRLGSGAMGAVYLAEHRRLRRKVALKLVLSGQLASREELTRFQLEAKAAAGLQHPGIVQIYEVGSHRECPFLAMEFVPGPSLSQHIAARPQPPKEAAETVERLARAMAYAHRLGIVHRDLKPGNILLAEASTNRDPTSSLSRLRFEPKITDFGLAKHDDSSFDFTRTGHVLGTPAYMAPEQARGLSHQAGPTADIYSLGAILYEMLTGRPPFRAATVLETLRQVQQESPTPPRRLRRNLPRDLETICLKCLEKDPGHRYADAEQLADDLVRFLRRQPVRVRPVGPLGRSWRWARRKPLLATLVALVAAVVLIGGPLVTALYFKADAESTRAQQQEQLAIKNLVELRSASSIQAMHDGDYDAALTMLESAIDERQKLTDAAAGVLSPDHLQQRYDAVKYRMPRRVQTFAVPREFNQGHTYAPTFVDDDSTLQFVDVLGKELWQASLDSDQPSTFRAVETPTGETIVYDSTAQWQLVIGGDPPWQLRKTDASVPPVSLEDPGDEFSHPAGALHVLPEERLVLNLHAGSCYCWDFRTGKFLKVIKTLYEWDCRRPYLLSFNWPTRFSLVRLPDFQMLLENIPFAGDFLSNRQCSGIAIAPSGELLAAAQLGGNVQILDLRQDPPAEVPSLLVQTAQVTAMRFNPSGRWLALGDDNGAMYLYDVLGRRVLPLDWQHRGAVTTLRFSADGLWLASGGDDGVVRIFNTTNGRVVMPKLVHSAAVVHTVFSSRGDQIAVLTEDKSLHLWDLRDSSPDRVLMHSSPVTVVAFGPDGQRLASGDQLGVVQIWDVPTGACTDRIESPRGAAGLQFCGDRLGVTGLTVPGGRGFSL